MFRALYTTISTSKVIWEEKTHSASDKGGMENGVLVFGLTK